MPRLQAIEDETLEKEPALLLPSDLQGRKEKKTQMHSLWLSGTSGSDAFTKDLVWGSPGFPFNVLPKFGLLNKLLGMVTNSSMTEQQKLLMRIPH